MQRLDDVDETYMKNNPTDEDLSQHYHQGLYFAIALPRLKLLLTTNFSFG